MLFRNVLIPPLLPTKMFLPQTNRFLSLTTAKSLKHHSCGTFTNQNKRTAFEFKEDDGSTVIADIKKWMPAL